MCKTNNKSSKTPKAVKKFKFVIKDKKLKNTNTFSYDIFINHLRNKCNYNSFEYDVFKKNFVINYTNIDLDKLKLKNVPKQIDYDDFIYLVCFDILDKINITHWKKNINIINSFDNTFALYWACHRCNKKTVELLIKNGALFDPLNTLEFIPEFIGIKNTDGDSGFKNPLLIVINMFDQINMNELEFLKFSDEKLNTYYKFLIYKLNNLNEILKLLLDNYHNVIYNDDNTIIALNLSMKYGSTEFIKIILEHLEKIKLDFNDMKKIINIFKKYINYYKEKYDQLDSSNDKLIIFKEYKRYKIIYILSQLYNFIRHKKKVIFKNKNTYFNIKTKVFNYFGSLSNSFSIFNINDTEINYSNLSYYLCDFKKNELILDQSNDFYSKYSLLFSLYRYEIVKNVNLNDLIHHKESRSDVVV